MKMDRSEKFGIFFMILAAFLILSLVWTWAIFGIRSEIGDAWSVTAIISFIVGVGCSL